MALSNFGMGDRLGNSFRVRRCRTISGWVTDWEILYASCQMQVPPGRVKRAWPFTTTTRGYAGCRSGRRDSCLLHHLLLGGRLRDRLARRQRHAATGAELQVDAEIGEDAGHAWYGAGYAKLTSSQLPEAFFLHLAAVAHCT